MEYCYDPSRHEQLIIKEWNQNHIDDLCNSIISETVSVIKSEKLWPVHELDSKEKNRRFTDFYYGSTGVLWLLDYLKDNRVNIKEVIDYSLKDYLENRSEADEKEAASVFFGETGIRLFKEKMFSSPENLDSLYHLIESHIDNQYNEVLYGNQGTLIASYELYKNTKENRFKELFKKTKSNVFNNWKWSEEYSCYLWTQHFEDKLKFIGAAHGSFGNIHALITCKDLLTNSELELIYRRSTELFLNLAQRAKSGGVNWKPRVDSIKTPLMHWCHGAPGVICSVADFLPRNKDVDALLLEAGESIWNAGPLRKGTSLCHGTSGNAMALLKLYKRFDDSIWLERAQQFLMHSIDQCLSLRKEYGQYRYSLWTGDLGIVLLNEEIKKGFARLPIFDQY